MRREPVGAFTFIRHATVTYKFRNFENDIYTIVTNKCPTGPLRSYGKMEYNYLVERLLDIAARKMGIAQEEIRRRNYVTPDRMPYETPTGALLDGGDYPKILKKLLDETKYEEQLKEQEKLRKQGKIIGIGIAMGMEAGAINSSAGRLMNPRSIASGDSDAAWVKVDLDGKVIVGIGTAPHGQGHETTVSQIVADGLGVHPDDVFVIPGFDSWTSPSSTPYSGTYGSRFMSAGAPATLGAARKVRAKVLRIASKLLKKPQKDLDLIDGLIYVKGRKSRLSIKDIAALAWRNVAMLPEDEEPGLFENYNHRVPVFGLPKDGARGNFSATYTYGACLVNVEIDPMTGFVKVRKIHLVEDCGNMINPLIMEGQIHGAMAAQLAGALYENITYDDEGQLLTASFNDYLVPSAADLPTLEQSHIVVPSVSNPFGARGAGEGGGAPLIACINAVANALAPMGIEIDSSFADPVWIRDVIKKHRRDG
jgi:2-furoyl-CoA dehydrogenase large subunit